MKRIVLSCLVVALSFTAGTGEYDVSRDGKWLAFVASSHAEGVYPDENRWILTRENSVHWYGEFRDWITRFAKPGPQ